MKTTRASFRDNVVSAFVVLRLGLATLNKSPTELNEMLKGEGEEATLGLLDEIINARDWFSGFAKVLDVVEARAMVAASRMAAGTVD